MSHHKLYHQHIVPSDHRPRCRRQAIALRGAPISPTTTSQMPQSGAIAYLPPANQCVTYPLWHQSHNGHSGPSSRPHSKAALSTKVRPAQHIARRSFARPQVGTCVPHPLKAAQPWFRNGIACPPNQARAHAQSLCLAAHGSRSWYGSCSCVRGTVIRSRTTLSCFTNGRFTWSLWSPFARMAPG